MSNATEAIAPPAAPSGFMHRRRLLEPSMLLWILLIGILVVLVASPLVRLIMSSFQEAETGSFTLANYAEAYGRVRHVQALLNSLELGAGVAILAVVFGVPIAWAISRTDMPAKGLVRLMVLGAFITPPYLGAIGWILLAGPNSGWLNKLWIGLTGADHGLFDIYTFEGLSFIIGIYSFPYIFIFTSAALELVSS